MTCLLLGFVQLITTIQEQTFSQFLANHTVSLFKEIKLYFLIFDFLLGCYGTQSLKPYPSQGKQHTSWSIFNFPLVRINHFWDSMRFDWIPIRSLGSLFSPELCPREFFQANFWRGPSLFSWSPQLRSCFFSCSLLSESWTSLLCGNCSQGCPDFNIHNEFFLVCKYQLQQSNSPCWHLTCVRKLSSIDSRNLLDCSCPAVVLTADYQCCCSPPWGPGPVNKRLPSSCLKRASSTSFGFPPWPSLLLAGSRITPFGSPQSWTSSPEPCSHM